MIQFDNLKHDFIKSTIRVPANWKPVVSNFGVPPLTANSSDACTCVCYWTITCPKLWSFLMKFVKVQYKDKQGKEEKNAHTAQI